MNPTPSSQSIKPQGPKAPSMYGAHGVILQSSLLVVISGLVFWFLVMPKNDLVASQRADLDHLKETEKSTASMLTKLNNLGQVLDSSTEQVAKLDELLPLDSRSTKVQVMLERYVGASGMSLANVTVDFPPEENIYASGNAELQKDPFKEERQRRIANVTLQVTGQMTQFESLLKTIETGSRLFDTQSIEVKGQDDGSLAIRLKLKTYFYVP